MENLRQPKMQLFGTIGTIGTSMQLFELLHKATLLKRLKGYIYSNPLTPIFWGRRVSGFSSIIKVISE